MGVEANYIRGGDLEYVELQEYMLRALEISTGSKMLVLLALQPFRMVVLRVLLVLGVLCYSSSSQHSHFLGLQYSYSPYSQYAQYLGHH